MSGDRTKARNGATGWRWCSRGPDPKSIWTVLGALQRCTGCRWGSGRVRARATSQESTVGGWITMNESTAKLGSGPGQLHPQQRVLSSR